NEQYNISINTYDLGVGSTFLTVYASKENYTSLNIRFKITVTSRPTYLDNLELDGIESNSITIAWNELFDITVSYNDTATNNFIDSASLQLIGIDYSQGFSEIGESYTLSLNTFDLSIGNNFLTLLAQKDNYSIASQLITITVEERATTIESILNRTSTIAINYPHGELLNITAIYNDASGPFIDDASVELREGSTAIYSLTKSPLYDQYSVEIYTNELNLGVNLLTLYAKLDNYSIAFVSITVTIDERDTTLDIYLDETPMTFIEKAYNEIINITVVYKDFSDAFIDGATVELREGQTLLSNIPKHLSLNQYTLLINTKNLNLGTNLLAIYANKDNYSAALVSVTIIVGERDTDIDVSLDGIATTAIDVVYDESVNITVFYNDLTGPFIDGATVELRKGETLLSIIPKHSSFNQYTLLINSKSLNLGTNLLAIYANKDNYSAALVSISITVDERDTVLDVYLEGNPTTVIERAYNENINITVVYNDLTGPFIDGATVELREGESIISTILKHSSFDQYSLIINTKILNLGTNLLVIYANKDNYSAAFISITITVSERDTNLDVYLEGVPTTVIEIAYGESLNITVIYSDLTGPFINDATVQLKTGTTVLDTFSKHVSFDQYNLTKDATGFNLGNNIFSIYAKKENYTVALTSILIIVTERDTSLSIYLEKLLTTSIEVIYGEFINITAVYEDFASIFIDGANVELREGTTTIDTFSKHATLNQYFLTKNSNELSLGGNVLSVYAKRENYSVSLVSILITVNERDTTLDILLDGIDSSSFEFYNISINDKLNITAIYEDFTSIFVSGATVELTGTGTSEFLIQHPTLNHYNYTLNPEDLGVGVHFLVISADKENYSASIINIKINVLERGSNLLLFIDGNDLTSSRHVAAEIDQVLNVTVYFTDSSDDSFISNANIRLTGALNDNFTENVSLEYYNVSIRTNYLNQGINFLTIFAQKQEYVSQSIVFTIEVREKESNLQLFLNGNNETLGKSVEVTIGEFVNVTVIYEDYAKNFIDNAEVLIVGEGIDLNLTKNPIYNQYNVTIDSDDLNFGINLLTLYAKRDNYQPQTLIVRIEIIEKETDMHIFLNGLNKTIDRTLTLPIRSSLNITVKYFEYDTGLGILGATIQLVGESLDEFLTYNPSHQQYSITIDTNQLDIGVRFLTVYAQRTNYQSFSALLRIQIDRIRTNITT
ncbi:MAG: hypothetical protein MUP85_20070, partial [Candidatus Lokiarchaeota archaeon]|nr:hypothetical protein [Candidatus Lokiarchaeota archaeon]